MAGAEVPAGTAVAAEAPDEFVGQGGLSGTASSRDAQNGGTSFRQFQRLTRFENRDRPGEVADTTRAQCLKIRTLRGQRHVTGAHELVDHAGQTQPLTILRAEDSHTEAGEFLDLLGDDDTAAPAEDLNVASAHLVQALPQVAEVLHVPALVGGNGDPLHVLLHRGCDDLVDAAVVSEVDDLRTLALQNAAHDVDRGVVAVEQAGRGDEPHRILGDVEIHTQILGSPTI